MSCMLYICDTAACDDFIDVYINIRGCQTVQVSLVHLFLT